MPMRSYLFTPAVDVRKIEKARSLDVDALIIDLEDGVGLEQKESAREAIRGVLLSSVRQKTYVRINAPGTPFSRLDLDAAVWPGLDGIVLPKTEGASEVKAIDWYVTALERERGLGEGSVELLPMLESAVGFENLPGIVRAGGRVRRVAFGGLDMATDLGVCSSADGVELLAVRSGLVLASRAAGLAAPVDGVYPDIRDPEGLTAETRRARQLGFGGKLLIHPRQIAVVNDVFAPSRPEAERARRIVAAFELAAAAGEAVIELEGQMVDRPVYLRAKQILSELDGGRDGDG